MQLLLYIDMHTAVMLDSLGASFSLWIFSPYILALNTRALLFPNCFIIFIYLLTVDCLG